MTEEELYAAYYADHYASAYADAQKSGHDDAYAKAYAEAYAEESAKGTVSARNRIRAILQSPEAKKAPNLADYLAFETSHPAEQAVGMLRAHAADHLAVPAATQQSESWEDRKRAAGAIGLAPAETDHAKAMWDRATADAHRFRGIEDPEIGATGRKLN